MIYDPVMTFIGSPTRITLENGWAVEKPLDEEFRPILNFRMNVSVLCEIPRAKYSPVRDACLTDPACAGSDT